MNGLQCPFGYTISFDTNGENDISPIVNTTGFKAWNKSPDFHGEFNAETNVYIFKGQDKTFFTANLCSNKLYVERRRKHDSKVFYRKRYKYLSRIVK